MDYEIIPSDTSPAMLAQYAQLLSLAFPGTKKFTEEFLNWQYVQNPNGKVFGFDAFAGGQLAAHYVTIPVIYLVNGKETKGLLSLNTATHPAHQGKGLFTKLASSTYLEAANAGYEFVIGVANQNSTPGFLNKLGFYLISPLEVKMGKGSIDLQHEYAEYKLKSFSAAETMEWRLGNPFTSYFTAGNRVYAHSGTPGIYALMSRIKPGPELKNLTRKKQVPLHLWIGLAEYKKTSGLFIPVPARLKPSPLNLIFKALHPGLPVFSKEQVYFELLDFDAY